MGTADLCGLASCLGLWLNKQVKSADKDTRWSSQPHLHPQLPPSLLHGASSSGLASPCATSRLLLPYITHPRAIVMVNLPHPAETQNRRSCINTQTPGKRLLTQRAALCRRQSSRPVTWDTICNVTVRIRQKGSEVQVQIRSVCVFAKGIQCLGLTCCEVNASFMATR